MFKKKKKEIPNELIKLLKEHQSKKASKDIIKYSLSYLNSNDNFKNEIKSSNLELSFRNTLLLEIEKLNCSDSFIYKKAHVDRRLFSKIINDVSYHPSKNTIICFGLALELSLVDFERLLKSANYSLPSNNYFNIAIIYCINKKIYDIDEVNDILYACDLPLLKG